MSDPRQDLGTWDVIAGDPLTITLNITSGGSPVNLTTIGSTWSAHVRQSPSTTPPVVPTIDASGASTGTLVLSLNGAVTGAMATDPTDPTVWHFDLQATGGTVTPQTPFKGTVQAWKVFTHA